MILHQLPRAEAAWQLDMVFGVRGQRPLIEQSGRHWIDRQQRAGLRQAQAPSREPETLPALRAEHYVPQNLFVQSWDLDQTQSFPGVPFNCQLGFSPKCSKVN